MSAPDGHDILSVLVELLRTTHAQHVLLSDQLVEEVGNTNAFTKESLDAVGRDIIWTNKMALQRIDQAQTELTKAIGGNKFALASLNVTKLTDEAKAGINTTADLIQATQKIHQNDGIYSGDQGIEVAALALQTSGAIAGSATQIFSLLKAAGSIPTVGPGLMLVASAFELIFSIVGTVLSNVKSGESQANMYDMMLNRLEKLISSKFSQQERFEMRNVASAEVAMMKESLQTLVDIEATICHSNSPDSYAQEVEPFIMNSIYHVQEKLLNSEAGNEVLFKYATNLLKNKEKKFSDGEFVGEILVIMNEICHQRLQVYIRLISVLGERISDNTVSTVLIIRQAKRHFENQSERFKLFMTDSGENDSNFQVVAGMYSYLAKKGMKGYIEDCRSYCKQYLEKMTAITSDTTMADVEIVTKFKGKFHKFVSEDKSKVVAVNSSDRFLFLIPKPEKDDDDTYDGFVFFSEATHRILCCSQRGYSGFLQLKNLRALSADPGNDLKDDDLYKCNVNESDVDIVFIGKTYHLCGKGSEVQFSIDGSNILPIPIEHTKTHLPFE